MKNKKSGGLLRTLSRVLSGKFGSNRFALENFFLNVWNRRKNWAFDEIFKGQYGPCRIVPGSVSLKQISISPWSNFIESFNGLCESIRILLDSDWLKIFQIAKKELLMENLFGIPIMWFNLYNILILVMILNYILIWVCYICFDKNWSIFSERTIWVKPSFKIRDFCDLKCIMVVKIEKRYVPLMKLDRFLEMIMWLKCIVPDTVFDTYFWTS